MLHFQTRYHRRRESLRQRKLQPMRQASCYGGPTLMPSLADVVARLESDGFFSRLLPLRLLPHLA
jgi:hypothetical protein